jgi:hypothetical protein
MNTILATEISKSLREGRVIRYKARKIGKKRKRNISDVKSIETPDRIECYSTGGKANLLPDRAEGFSQDR